MMSNWDRTITWWTPEDDARAQAEADKLSTDAPRPEPHLRPCMVIIPFSVIMLMVTALMIALG